MADKLACKLINVATAGTATQVDSSSRVVRRLRIHNPSTNGGLVYFGGPDLDATHRCELKVSELVELAQLDISQVYVTTAVNNEKVEVAYY
jgi:hypothetical protein